MEEGARDINPQGSINTTELESDPLIPREPQPQPMVVPSALKLGCMAYLLIIAALGFITTTIETEALIWHRQLIGLNFTAVNCDVQREKSEKWISDVICYIIKSLYPITLMAAIVYLQHAVLVQGTVRRACVNSDTSGKHVILSDVNYHIEMTENLGGFPSALLITTYLVFFVAYCFSSVVDIISKIFDLSSLKQPTEMSKWFDVVRQILLLVSTVLQTMFFVVKFKRSIQWKLYASWLCLAHILATNIALWFLTVGLEVQEFITADQGNDVCHANDTKSKNSEISPTPSDTISRLLYPFAIEYYVMSSLMAFTMMINIGKVGSLLQEQMRQNFDTVRKFVLTFQQTLSRSHSEGAHIRADHRARVPEFTVIQDHSCSFFIGLGAIVISLVVSVFTRGWSDNNFEINAVDLIFQVALIVVYISGIVCTVFLLRILSASSQHQLSSTHFVDRALLWLGVAAIVTNELYTLMKALTSITEANYIPYHLLLLDNSILNIAQSLLQVFALESALARKFSNAGSGGRAVLNVLILLNVSQWIINAVCFNFFVPKGQVNDALVMRLLALPLQVLYRFHSAACMHEFKEHCEPEDQHRALQPPAANNEPLEVQFQALFEQEQDPAEDHING